MDLDYFLLSCRHTWEPELVSPFHQDRSWTFFGVLCLLLGGACFVVCLLFCCPRLVFLLSTMVQWLPLSWWWAQHMSKKNGILLCRRGEVLSAPRVFLVLKRSFTVSHSSLDVLFGSGWCLFVLFAWVFCSCFGLLLDIQPFEFSPALQQLEIRWPTMPRDRSAIATKKTEAFFFCKMQRFAPRLSFKNSPNAAPATKSDTWTSHPAAPATYSTLFYFTWLYSTWPCSTLLYSTWLDCTLLYPTWLFSTWCYPTCFYPTLLYSTWRYSTWLYSTWLYSDVTWLYWDVVGISEASKLNVLW